MNRQRIIILMGSKSDLSFAQRIGSFIEREGFKVEYDYAVSSAHRTPDHLINKLRDLEGSRDRIVIITVAGLSDALSGFVAGFSTYPVIACPPDVERGGFAKIFSTVMTPTGVPVLLSTKPENAALAAVKILSLADPSLRPRIREYINKKREEVIGADMEVSGGGKGE
ncbi:MAG: N5-carboxyaminoimidazole ribonucleotide mutase [Candidatus Bathyarchaeota archaeon B63]|nr:MAG: N5-carboxyaminoimidazole ribonucleotide mutase [Candidatus Bathyarchaeota archaeon B63]